MINGGNSFPNQSTDPLLKTSSICVQTFNLILSFQFGAVKLIGRSIFSRHGIFNLHFTIKFNNQYRRALNVVDIFTIELGQCNE